MPRALRPRKQRKYATRDPSSDDAEASSESTGSGMIIDSEYSTADESESEYEDDVIFKAIRRVRKSRRLKEKEGKQKPELIVIDSEESSQDDKESGISGFVANVTCSRFLRKKKMKRKGWETFQKKICQTTEHEHSSVLRKQCPAYFKKKDETVDPEETVEKFLVKWSDFSFLHCSWEEIEDLKALGASFHGKAFWDRKMKKLEEEGEIDQMLFCKVDRVLDNPDDELLIKWEHLSYDECSYEYRRDVLLFCQETKLQEKEMIHERRAFVKPRKNLSNYSSEMTFKNGCKLRSYQVESVEWLTFNIIQGRNSIIADEMGLGKTLQAICFMHRLCFSLRIKPRFLVIAPLATLENWIREIDKWDRFYAVPFYGGKEGRRIIKEFELKKRFNILVTNFDLAFKEMTYLGGFDWNLVVVDEAHRLKNDQSKLSKAIKNRLKMRRCLLLTGTPIQNNLKELWTLLNFVAPKEFQKWKDFEEKWIDLTSPNVMDEFQEMLGPYMLRRIKTDVEKLPPKKDTLIEVEMTTLQKRFYRAIYEKNRRYLKNAVNKAYHNDKLRIRNGVSLKNVAIQLRKCCNHPYLLKGVEDIVRVELQDDIEKVKAKLESDKGFSDKFEKYKKDSKLALTVNEVKDFELITKPIEELLFDKFIRSSGKLILLDKLLPSLKQKGNRILMFSQWTRILDILEDYINGRQYTYERIDGGIQSNVRQLAIDRFNNVATHTKKKEKTFIFLLSTRACGQGINLTSADTVIMYDGDWNPQNDIQAMARCHRIGQKKTVHIYRLITSRSYEKTMFEAASKKLGLDQAITNNLEKRVGAPQSEQEATLSKTEQNKETERLLKYGAFLLAEDDTNEKEFLNESIEHILANRTINLQDNAKDKLQMTKLSKAKFGVNDSNKELDIADPNFWEKIVGVEGFDEKAYEHENILHNKRKRKHVVYNQKLAYDDLSSSDSDFVENSEDVEDSESEENVIKSEILKAQPKTTKKKNNKAYLGEKRVSSPYKPKKKSIKQQDVLTVHKPGEASNKSKKDLATLNKTERYMSTLQMRIQPYPVIDNATSLICEIDPISGLIYKPAVAGATCHELALPQSYQYNPLTSIVCQNRCQVLRVLGSSYCFSEFYKFAVHQQLLSKVNRLKEIRCIMLHSAVSVTPKFYAKILDYMLGFGYRELCHVQSEALEYVQREKLDEYATVLVNRSWFQDELAAILRAVAVYIVLIEYNYCRYKKEPILLCAPSSSKSPRESNSSGPTRPSLIPNGFFLKNDRRADKFKEFVFEVPTELDNGYIQSCLCRSGYNHISSLFLPGNKTKVVNPVHYSWLITASFDILWSAETYYRNQAHSQLQGRY